MRTKEQQRVIDFLQRLPESECRALTTACKDWDEINPVIREIGALTEAVRGDPEAIGSVWCAFTEQVYTMGYKRGETKSAQGLPVFVVADSSSKQKQKPLTITDKITIKYLGGYVSGTLATLYIMLVLFVSDISVLRDGAVATMIMFIGALIAGVIEKKTTPTTTNPPQQLNGKR